MIVRLYASRDLKRQLIRASARKYPGILDLGELLPNTFLNLADTPLGAGVNRTLSPRRPTAAEDSASLYPSRTVGDTIRCLEKSQPSLV